MFDITREIKLQALWNRLYQALRLVILLLFLTATIYVTYRILFPIQEFDFFFRTAGALKNTIADPHTVDNHLLFDTALVGNFSTAKLDIILEKDSPPLQRGKTSARKSFRAFFYPEGAPLGFKDGSLISSNGEYFIVSKGELRKFANAQIADRMGYNLESFIGVSNDELKYNKRGGDIASTADYPEDTVFVIDSDYYQLKNGGLQKFVSEKAFDTQYEPDTAIAKDPTFLQNYTVSEKLIGFADGTLLSHNISAFIIGEGKLHPINNVTTFESMGFDWNDVIPASGEEIGIYEKAKLFSIDQPHPDGVIFKDKENQNYYIIRAGMRRLLPSQHITDSYLKKNPVIAEESSLATEKSCQLHRRFGFARRYTCEITIEFMQGIIGNDYQFLADLEPDVKIKELHVTFSRNLNWSNARLALSEIKKKILLQYGKSE